MMKRSRVGVGRNGMQGPPNQCKADNRNSLANIIMVMNLTVNEGYVGSSPT